jgi:hypothetical protein
MKKDMFFKESQKGFKFSEYFHIKNLHKNVFFSHFSFTPLF